MLGLPCGTGEDRVPSARLPLPGGGGRVPWSMWALLGPAWSWERFKQQQFGVVGPGVCRCSGTCVCAWDCVGLVKK